MKQSLHEWCWTQPGFCRAFFWPTLEPAVTDQFFLATR